MVRDMEDDDVTRNEMASVLKVARTHKVRAVRSALAGFRRIARYHAIKCRETIACVKIPTGFSRASALRLWTVAGHANLGQTQWLPGSGN